MIKIIMRQASNDALTCHMMAGKAKTAANIAAVFVIFISDLI